MNRDYRTSFYAGLSSKIRSRNPSIAVGTDLIVGFPGETDTNFEETCDFILKQSFSRIHVFRFSPRPGTKAAELPDRIAGNIQETRSRIVQQIAAGTASEYAGRFLGRTVQVLFEDQNQAVWSGLSGEYLRVRTSSELDLNNRMRQVLITEIDGNYLRGKLLL